MSRPWIRLWKSDLNGSRNFNSLTVYERGIYLQLYLICLDDKYSGVLCKKDGTPFTIDEIVQQLNPKRGDRKKYIREAIIKLISAALLKVHKNYSIEIVNYRIKTQGKSSFTAPFEHYLSTSHIDIKGDKSKIPIAEAKSKHISQPDIEQCNDKRIYVCTSEEQSKSFRLIVSMGLPEKQACRYAVLLPAQKIREVIVTRACTQKIRNPAGYLRNALESEIKQMEQIKESK